MSVISGKAAFINLTEHEQYQGQSTGKYSIVVTLDNPSAELLKGQGVKVRLYEDSHQRKFASKFDTPIFDINNDPFIGTIPRGSLVKVQYTLGQEHPVHGITPYLDKIRVVELAESDTDEDF